MKPARPQTRTQIAAHKHPRLEWQWLAWVLLGLALTFFIWQASSFPFLQDDSYITYRYARNVVRGLGPVFNPGERVEGYTNFIWMMLLAALGVLGVPFSTIIPLSQILGVVCGAGVIVLFFLLFRRLTTGPPLLAGLAVLLLGANGSFAYWCVSGMETGLFSLLICAATYFYLTGSTPRHLFLCSGLFGLAALTRPEGALFWGIVLLDFLIRTFWSRRPAQGLATVSTTPVPLQTLPSFLTLLAPFLILVIPQYVWRLTYYGQLFPNTFYAKTGLSLSYISTGIQYVVQFYQAYGIWGLGFLIPVLLAVRSRRFSPGFPLFFCALALFIHALYTVSVGGDVLRIYRFFVPVLFLFYLFVTEGLWLTPTHSSFRLFLLMVLVAITYSGILARPTPVRNEIRRNHILETGLVDKMSKTGTWLNTHLGPDDWFACTTIGAVSWFSDRNMIDMLGLTDAVIAHKPEDILARKLYWKERNYNTRHVLEKLPAYIYFSTGIKPSAAAERALFLRPRFRRGYYACLISIPEKGGRFMSEYIHKKRPGADTIPLEPVYDKPEFIDHYVDGINFLRHGPDSALAAIRKCIAICPPDFGYPFEWAGQAFLDYKPPKIDSAIIYFEEAVRRDDWCVSSHTNLGSIYSRLGQQDKAAEHLRKAWLYSPDYLDAYVNLAVVYTAMRNFAAAETVLLQAWEKFPTANDLLLRLAYVRLESARYEEAQEVLERYLEKLPGDQTARTMLEFARQKRPLTRSPQP